MDWVPKGGYWRLLRVARSVIAALPVSGVRNTTKRLIAS